MSGERRHLASVSSQRGRFSLSAGTFKSNVPLFLFGSSSRLRGGGGGGGGDHGPFWVIKQLPSVDGARAAARPSKNAINFEGIQDGFTEEDLHALVVAGF